MSLSHKFCVSRETIRKDLFELQEEGVLKKIHGGAILDSQVRETNYEKRKNEEWNGKGQIAHYAIKYIEPGDTLYLDYGTTVLALAREIAKLNNFPLTIVTNSLPIVNLLLPKDQLTIIIPGGIARPNEASLYGQFAETNIQDIFVTIGFFGCSGIDRRAAITNPHLGEVQISKKMMSHSQTVILLADHTKFGNVAINRIAEMEQVDVLITDESLGDSFKECFGSYGVEFACVSEKL